MRVTGVILVATHLLVASMCRASTTDWDAWYDGDVQVRLSVQGGEGAVFAVGSDVCFEFEATESAYHMVVGIDPQGAVQLLFPRFWEDDGWVRRGSIQRVRAGDFATSRRPWRGTGIVYVEVISSPTPFDWQRAGLRRTGETCRWSHSGRPLIVEGDPFDAFNELHRRLFPRWDHALFTVDYTWFYLGARCDTPQYVGAEQRRRATAGQRVVGEVGVRVWWDWHFGPWCARPVYGHASLSTGHRSLPRRTRQARLEPIRVDRTVRERVRVETDPRVQRKLVRQDRSTQRRADERVVVRQQVVEKQSEERRRKLK